MIKNNKDTWITASRGISLPIDMWERIESDRGDVSRSRFIFRILEQYYIDKDYVRNKVVNKK
jgi:hypothetical protein